MKRANFFVYIITFLACCRWKQEFEKGSVTELSTECIENINETSSGASDIQADDESIRHCFCLDVKVFIFLRSNF